MSPTLLHAEQEHDDDQKPLNINKDSNFINHLPPFPSTKTTTVDGVANTSHQSPPKPVVIYMYSPKVIHAHPHDFMALVQKLTGYTRPPPEETQPTQDQRQHQDLGNVEYNQSSYMVKEEHGSSVNDVPQVNSCFVDGGVGVGVGVGVAPPPYKVADFDPYFNDIPVFPTNQMNFLCTPTHQLPFYTPDSLLLNRNSFSSSSSFRVHREY